MAEREGSRNPRVLLVDDEANARLLARVSLERVGCDVTEAADGHEALEKAGAALPDLILLDVVMPGPDGFTVCEQLRARAAFANVPIVMMTALEDLASVERAYAAGATDFISKPVNWTLLQHRARFVLRSADTVLQLAESQERLEEAQRIARLGSWALDPATDAFTGSDELWRILSRAPGQVPTGATLLDLVHEGDRRHVQAARAAARDASRPYEIEYRIHPTAEELLTVVERGEILLQRDGSPLLVGTVQDVTEERRRSEQMQHMTTHDAVTGLLNRRGFQEQVDLRLGRRGAAGIIAYVSMGFLEAAARIMGPDQIDELLEGAGRDLEAAAERTGSMGGISARLTGDEFAVFIPLQGDASSLDSEVIGAAISAALAQPSRPDGPSIARRLAIGVAIAPDDGVTGAVLARKAQIAATACTSQGVAVLRYDAELEAQQVAQATLESELRGAVERDELQVHFQPLVDLASGTIRAAETLVRWQNRHFGWVGPDRFIPIAEELGLIEEIGAWVLRAACRDAVGWKSSTGEPPAVAVNLSAAQFRDRDALVDLVEETLDESGLAAGRLDLELTESLLVQASGQVAPALSAFRELGVSISLDDFGTGYSSLSYLTRFPIDLLKVDRSFLTDVPGDPRRENLVAAIITLSHGLGMEVVVEGVETAEQLGFLRAHGADMAQGYLLSRPIPPADFAELLLRGIRVPGSPTRERAAS